MRAFLTALLACLAAAAVAPAGQPDWQTTQRQLLVMRWNSWYSEHGRPNRGLWSFDPDSGVWDRLRPFDYNAVGYPRYKGEGSALAGGDGVLVFQGWPYWLELEPGSWRVLRRTTPHTVPAAVGWGVQGPVVTPALGAEFGLEPGVYGFGQCLVSWLTGDWEWGTPIWCDPYELPAGGGSMQCWSGEPWPLVHRSEEGRLGLVTHLAAADYERGDYALLPRVLSLDPERGALWRGTPRGVELLPIEGGTVGQPSYSATFDFEPFDDPEVTLDSLFYHPTRHELFLVARGYFLGLDESLQPGDPYLPPYMASNVFGTPITMAALHDPPAEHEQLLPVVAHAPGRRGTLWTSELWLYNPSAEPSTVGLRRVMAPATARSVDLPGHGSLRVTDALAFLGGGPDGDGSTHDAVVLTAPWRWGEQVVAVSRSSTPAPGGGSYGHAVTAVPGRTGYSNHQMYYGEPEPDWLAAVAWNAPAYSAAELDLDLGQAGRFRHNLGVVNDSDEPVTLTLLWGHLELSWAHHPNPVAERPPEALQELVVPAHSLRIVDIESLFPGDVREAWPPRIGVWGDRPAALWLSMVDNLTGDATFVPYSGLGWQSIDHQEVRTAVPVAVHGVGEAGTRWRTDMISAIDDDTFSDQAGIFHPADPELACGGAALDGELLEYLFGEVPMPSLPPLLGDAIGWRTIERDVVHEFPACAGDDDVRGGLELVAGTWQAAWTRTHATRPDGGTYGGMLPFYPLGGWPVQHFAGIELGPERRVNVGFFNGDHEHAIRHRITLYATSGEQVAERMLTLEPLASFQRRIEHLFVMEAGALPAGTYGMTVLPLDDEERGVKGRSWAYVSLVDNVTGDPCNWW